jgi:prepilin-type N-terminal cleavage/methylation domain-containing protein/prepilin-type processing-associated H-X9-DG protein
MDTLPPRRSLPSGFTLVEILVVISILGIMMALLLPALQSAREAACRTRCANSLKQLALAAHGYHAAFGCLPMGTPYYRYPDVGVFAGQSGFVSMLGHLDQQPLYSAVNFDRNIYTYSNQTIHEVGLAVLWCPSDDAVRRRVTVPGPYLDIPEGRFVTALSSYAFCAGTWYHLARDEERLRLLSAQDNGVSFANSAVRFSEITDGLSRTILLGERTYGRLGERDRVTSYWWFDGYPADTLFWTLHPINPHRVLSPNATALPSPHPLIASAGSFHPGGAHFAFADGSVSFLKETIDSWPISPDSGMPAGVTGSLREPYKLMPAVRPGLYQALSTRNGGEVIDQSATNR